ncbi:hypothetical protein FGSG_01582 [Fusarium graminearum PH-1]|uniref:RNA-dependent RNA polymerase n=1 Tax=Gibberella zeae (strain ATCC MYA-4620 / CBS 123657 / FGSC 9075 / NRRL 31084 / PH-1) TaxID=229533 RepID=I1RD90_GIBZE|nr:hypothetical protein FGSG_01582 [Fusarium graminearum PH-1]ESU06913.1 hypothetical protein FGSG_01582 [Fusarium graminearum PH-1]EYB22647.1 hypothetical protein FG05_01582 [Fusarium graminearum]CEF73734.1 unnamed protein product [Fusarium graminearum]|eukprot:XP_011317398.1 hypothetical protein FGSG_01582 [Fusarium graminearum PH-1]
MEVICRNVPLDLSEDNFKRELLPFMKALNISDFYCEKPRRKSQAWIKFLSAQDGSAFLARHGKQRRCENHGKENIDPSNPLNNFTGSHIFRSVPRDIARLHILKTAVFVEQSTKPVDKYAIAHLKHEREKKKQSTTTSNNKGRHAPEKAFQVSAISCGGNTFHGPNEVITFVDHHKLLFRPEAVTGKFTSQWLTIQVEHAHRMDFHNETIQDLIATRSDMSITLVLTEPPKMYTYRPPTFERSMQEWSRVHGLHAWGLPADCTLSCLVYRIYFYDTISFDQVLVTLKNKNILAITNHDLPSVRWIEIGAESNHTIGRQTLVEKSKNLLTSGRVHFALLFQVQALVWNNFINPASGIKLLDLLECVIEDHKKRKVAVPVTTDAMKKLFQTIPYPCPGTEPKELDVVSIMTNIMDAEYEARKDDPERDRIYGGKLPPNQIWVFKALVTPTRLLLDGPEAESKNRVLRKYADYNDYFLRVLFCEEGGQDLRFHPKVDNEPIYSQFRRMMDHGIQIAGRKFDFLGFSHSSLRSHSAWFSAPFIDKDRQLQSPEAILQALGDFRDIRVPAKCAARIGQAFSETPYAVPIFENNIVPRYIPDVKSEDGSRVFSDGVGTISQEALEAIWPYLSMNSAAPTCLQIRWGGCKGMLSLDTRLEGKVFCIRQESMMKFKSEDTGELGICDTASKPLRLVLNRQMIKILEDMGTRDEWFFELQNNALDILRNVTADATNTSSFLEHQAIGINMGLPRLVKQLEKMDIDYRRDKFLKAAVEHVVLRELRLLKHKARIPVDNGVTLFGIMDETGFLKEGEVYVTYDKTYGRNNSRGIKSTLTDGEIIVTRSPALHPGDIQLVKQVTPPQGHSLRSLQNCIVFSQKGKRDLPSMLSGGDLDGDIYNIIWDPEAMPSRVFRPADYPRVTPQPLDRQVEPKDIADFFINFMRTDILGVIATRHVILADYNDLGSIDRDCIALAELHSTAVDFSKTGIPVNVKALPRAPRFRPDFLATAPPLKLYDKGQLAHIGEDDEMDDADDMARTKTNYYQSEKILGQLYRNVDEKKIWDEDIHRRINTAGPSVWDQLLTIVENEAIKYKLDIDWKRQSQEAWKIRGLYESSIEDKRWHFSENPRVPLTEVEVFCGFILNKRGAQTRRQGDASIKLKEEIDRTMTWIVKQIRDRGVGDGAETLSTVTEADGTTSRWREDVVELCWACVAVSCIKKDNAPELYHGNGELESFHIVAASCLVRELNNLARKMETAAGGGFVGVGCDGRSGRGGRGGKSMTLPIR